ncbi:MAG: hypothetical protein SYNGOMJ08_00628 [Candidatus Syntrophoarchaeum sp. GoM_oil]|nr:MAG: hypothetical protein SYNGOMJ08_00628 [Candidatus Syntrophoarchaeum sp. GoM_oil]
MDKIAWDKGIQNPDGASYYTFFKDVGIIGE